MGIKLRALLAATALAAGGFAFITGTPPAGAVPSDDYCPAGSVNVFNGTLGGASTRVAVYAGSPSAVCVRWGTIGGALVVGSPSGLPSNDSDLSACTNYIVNGTVLDTTDVKLGFGRTDDDVSMCLAVGSTAIRVRIPVGSGSPVNLYLDGDDGGVIDDGIPWPDEGCSNASRLVITIPIICVQYTPPIG